MIYLDKKISVIIKMIAVGLLLVGMGLSQQALAQEAVCAEVKIEIKQELTLERQAFDANMKINNDLDLLPLKDVEIEVNFEDADGNPVLATSDPNDTSAKFFIRIDSMQGIDAINGSGTVDPKTQADIHWLIIPSPGASEDSVSGTLYFVGADLSYTVGGELETVSVTPDFIRVKPLPEITLDYFLTRYVNADDPFTTEIESAEPFTLGVRVQNNGAAAAENLKIESAQPKIVENDQGLLIDFVITGSTLNDLPRAPTLLIDFGTIPAGKSSMGRWIMETTLAGEFTEFSASFTHADSLGGAVTSLLQAANTHSLVHDVRVDLPGRDLVRDFLADNSGALTVYESNNVDSPVTNQSVGATLQFNNASGQDSIYTLTANATTGFMYVKLSDSYNGAKVIREVIRSDGKRLPTENAWFSKERAGAGQFDYYLHLFDVNSPGSYTVVLSDKVDVPLPPAMQFIPDRTTHEGKQISFLLEASDPNGTIPIFSSPNLPQGATLTDQNNGKAVFDWIPTVGQAGVYEITYTASDGLLSYSRKAFITVNPGNDTDGDGMDDAWELEHFGTLDRDGTGDFDGDGISDLDEFLQDTSPELPEFFNFVTGLASVGSGWVDVALSGFSQPVVISGVPTDNEADAALVRLDQVGPTGFRLHLQEWPYADATHALEGVPYLVMEAGRHVMSDGSIWEVGSFDVISEQRWQAKGFLQPFAGTPRVYLAVQSNNDTQAVVVRARNVTVAGFEAALFEEESGSSHGREQVGYLAIYGPQDSATINIAGTDYQVNSTTLQLTDVGQLLDDGVTTLSLQEETSQDAELIHAAEAVVALTINDFLFATDNSSVEADTVVMRRHVDVATVATPFISPAGGIISEPVTVTLSTTTPGALIYYTLDGSTPDPVANALATQAYTAPFVIDATMTLSTIGKLDGYADSLVATAGYTLVTNTPPQFIALPDRSVVEEQSLSFMVQALDQNTVAQAALSVDLTALPGTPSFVDYGDGTGRFSWIAPIDSTTGSPYTLTFIATDAQDAALTTSAQMQIIVTSAADLDTDGDGLPDAWELQYSLDPNDPSDAAGDADQDGISNLQEFQQDSNPLVFDQSANVAPVAQIVADSSSGPAPLTIQFTGSGSTDSDGTITGYAWDFGDGETSTETNPSYTFTSVGNITVTLTVTDNMGATHTASFMVHISDPLDTDSDGMRDSWEMIVIGSLISDGTGDFNGDGISDWDEYLVWVNNGYNFSPEASDDLIATVEDSPVGVAVLSNDSDLDGDVVSILSVIQGANGTVTIASDSNTLSYLPNSGFTGTDSFEYSITDGQSQASGTVNVTIAPYLESPYRYHALNPALANGSVQVVSLINGNTINAGATFLHLDRYEVGVIPAVDLPQGGLITGTGPFDLSGDADGTDMLVPASFAATEFVVPLVRDSHRFYLLSPGVAANAQIMIDGSTTDLSLAADSVTMYEVNATNTTATVITSDQPLLVLHSGLNGTAATDVYPLAPPVKNAWGVRSNEAVVAAVQDNTTVFVYSDDGLSERFVLNAAGQQTISTGLNGANGLGSAVHVVADKPIMATQHGDAGDGSIFLSSGQFGKRFGLPLDSQYLAVICTQDGTVVTVDDGVTPQSQTCSGDATQPGKLYFGSDLPTSAFFSGTRIKANYPVALMYESFPAGDEHNLMGSRWSNSLVQVTQPGDQDSVEGDVINLAIVATDADNDPVAYSVTGLPAGLQMDAAGVISGTVSTGSAGMYQVAVTLSDGLEPVRLEFIWSVSVAGSGNNNLPAGFPIITGLAEAGQVLNVDVSEISDADGLGTFSYLWQADGVDIAGGTASSYSLSLNDVGKLINVVVSYTDLGGTLERLISAVVGPVIDVNRLFDPDGNLVCFYSEAYYSGEEFCYNEGQFATIDVAERNIYRSVRVPSTLEVFAFASTYFYGSSAIYSEDTASLDQLNNNIEALKIYDLSIRQFDPLIQNACFYTRANYQGAEFCYSMGDVSTLKTELRNVFQSLKVPDNVEVLGFSSTNYYGNKLLYASDSVNLSSLNQDVESLKIFDGSIRSFDPAMQNVCFYTQANYQGTEFCYGVEDYSTLGRIERGMFQSMRIPDNVELFGFDNTYYYGARVIYSQDVPLLSMTLNSFIIYDLSTPLFDPAMQNVCFYTQANYQGAEFCYGIGEHSTLGRIEKGTFQSLRIPDNVELFGFADTYFYGVREVISDDVPFLSMNISSFISYDLSSRQFDPAIQNVCYYTKASYQGAEFCYGLGEHATLDRREMGLFQSVRVPDAVELFGFDNTYFYGTRKVYAEDVPLLTMNNSSFIAYDLSSRQFDPAIQNVCYYTKANYQGAEFCYGLGEHATIDRREKGLFQSVRVPGNVELFGFDNTYFYGTREVYAEDVPVLTMNNSSFIAYDLSNRQFDPLVQNVCYYTKADYQGAEFCYGIGQYSSLDRRPKGLFQSVRVPNNVELFGFDNTYYYGVREVYSADIPSLTMNINSFIAYDLSSPLFDSAVETICFYSQLNYQGAEFCYGIGQYPSLDRRQSDLFQSVRVPTNVVVEAFSTTYYSGSMNSFTEDTGDLGILNADVSSFKALAN